MKILKFSVLFLMFVPIAFGQSCNTVPVVTGYGYLTDSKGHVISYTAYPIGKVCIPTGMTYTEVANQASLKAITLYSSPLTADQQQANLNNAALQEVIAHQIANDPKLAAQQAAITKS